MADVKIDYDKNDQLSKIQPMILEGETLYAVYDMKGGGTGFIAITDIRLIFMDQAFVRKAKAMVSLPYSKITAIGSEDSGGLINFFATSKLLIIAGSREWEFEFRSTDKAHKAYNMILKNMLQHEIKGV